MFPDEEIKLVNPYAIELENYFSNIRKGCIFFAVGVLLGIFVLVVIFLNLTNIIFIILLYVNSIPSLILMLLGIFQIGRNVQYLQRFFPKEKKQLFNLPQNFIIYYFVGLVFTFLMNFISFLLTTGALINKILNIIFAIIDGLIPLLFAAAFIFISVLLLRLNYIDGMFTRMIYSSYILPVAIIVNFVSSLMILINYTSFWYTFSFITAIVKSVCEIAVCIELFIILMKVDTAKIIDFHIKIIL